jgi:RimJ/RimL family protein N-acetyltransferase
MSAAGRALVDGGGAARVLRRVEGLELRSATMADARLLWTWANEPDVRRSSLSPDPIPWESHERWLSARLASPDCRMLIAHDPDGAPVGQIRFDRSEGEAEIDVSVAPQARGEGWGAEIIRLGCERVHAEDFAGRLHARVLPSNAASLRAFERAGFRQAGAATVKGKETVHLVREPA